VAAGVPVLAGLARAAVLAGVAGAAVLAGVAGAAVLAGVAGAASYAARWLSPERGRGWGESAHSTPSWM